MTDRTEATPGGVFDSTDFRDMGLSHYSEKIGEGIGKDVRRQLVVLRLRGYREELRDKPLSHNSRGRPKTEVACLADATGVSKRTVHRWLVGEGAKACDVNTGRLAEIAYAFYPEETSRILIEDANGYSRQLSSWLNSRAGGIFATTPCRIIRGRGG